MSFRSESLKRVEEALDQLPQGVGFNELEQAMRYSVTAGGKRLRPLLVLAAAEAVGGEVEALTPAAAAVELLHTYSLVHDDLPAMDDDEFRRGRPTLQRAFGEAIAILAGDALLTEAFALLASEAVQTVAGAERTLWAIRELAAAAGVAGLCSGQAEDLRSEGTEISAATLERIHRNKTGRLFRAAVRIGGILGGGDEVEVEALGRFGEGFGLAFQIIDDLLDVVGDPERLGKGARKDDVRRKATYPSLWGLDIARQKATAALEAALAALATFGADGEELRALARESLARDH